MFGTKEGPKLKKWESTHILGNDEIFKYANKVYRNE